PCSPPTGHRRRSRAAARAGPRASGRPSRGPIRAIRAPGCAAPVPPRGAGRTPCSLSDSETARRSGPWAWFSSALSELLRIVRVLEGLFAGDDALLDQVGEGDVE